MRWPPASALGERGVNITGIVGIAEDTDGALMLTTSDAALTRAAFQALGLPYEEHDPDADSDRDRYPGASKAHGEAEPQRARGTDDGDRIDRGGRHGG